MVSTSSGNWLVQCAAVGSMIITMCFGCASVLPAQAKRISGDLGTGFFNGQRGGLRNVRNGLSTMGQLAGRIQTKGSRSILAAINLTGFLTLDDERCPILEGYVVPGGGCIPNFPSGVALSVMTGIEQRLPRIVTMRLLAGPALYNTDESKTKLGVQTRLDFAVPANQRAAFVLWGQYGHMPLDLYQPAGVPMFGLGLRLQ